MGPIHISDEAISLSAILLDDEYYELLKNGVVEVDEVSVLDLVHIILFKIKAWLDLSERRENGEHIDSKNIKKHKIDAFGAGMRNAGQTVANTFRTVFRKTMFSKTNDILDRSLRFWIGSMT